ncbi:hypothetical protein CYMTET_26578 [Cymbomonas tetramitiformis]|uniref:MD-2-related lipid-recognition domain-containing protein n=1 Tax=Cymbomonas tetramitiformis TaxID=36881 RepID=A0AAE0FRG5_9CHLO|nr:hypothetical protein CYMTET_26578 [Cymbomonas tetramitiformis]
MSPYPIVEGQDLTVRAAGTTAEQLEDGSVAEVRVKLYGIKVFSETVKLCEGENCPIAKGPLEAKISTSVPRVGLSATVTVEVAIKDENGAEVDCVEHLAFI